MKYIDVEEWVLSRYCSSGKICFWVNVALINPTATDDLYVFDCSMYRLLTQRYVDQVDSRLLLSYKSPMGLREIRFTGNLGFDELLKSTQCSRGEIEEYINTVLSDLDKAIEKAREDAAGEKTWFFTRITPSRLSRSLDPRGRYYGLLVRESIIRDITGLLGYVNGRLNANVSEGLVLYSYEPTRGSFNALIGGNVVKLKALSKMIDVGKLLKALGRCI